MTGTLGVSLGLWQDRDPLEALPTARLADALGYDELWVGEMATFDAFTLATAVARETARIPLCVGPLATAVRDPMAMAMGAASVSALAAGRTVGLALGSSSDVVVSGWHGRERARTATHIAESVAALRPLLGGQKADVAGTLVHTRGYRLRLPPPPTSVTVAAFGPATVRVAARQADRMVVNLVTPALTAELAELLRAEAYAAGVSPPRLAAWVVAAVDPSADAVTQMSAAVVGYLAAPGYAEMFRAAGFGELVDFARARPHPRELLAQVPPELCAAVGLVGDLATVTARAEAYRAAGVDDLVLVPATAGDDGGERTLTALTPSESSAAPGRTSGTDGSGRNSAV